MSGCSSVGSCGSSGFYVSSSNSSYRILSRTIVTI
jgi:hypothetical protein